MRKLSRLLTTWADDLLKSQPSEATTRREHLITTAVALATAYRLPIPSGPAESAEQWYIQNVVAHRDDVLYSLNELVVLDIASAEKIVKTLWMIRYNLVHNPGSLDAIRMMGWMVERSDQIAPVYKESVNLSRGDMQFNDMQLQLTRLMDEYFTLKGNEATHD